MAVAVEWFPSISQRLCLVGRITSHFTLKIMMIDDKVHLNMILYLLNFMVRLITTFI